MVTLANRPLSQYRPPLRTRDLPLPPRWTPREKAIAERRLTQFVVLSMLLHTIAILLFGAPVGGSREGRAMWGSLNVVIRQAMRPAPIRVTPEVQVPVPALPPPAAPVVEETKATQPPPVDFPPLLDRLAPSEMKIDPAVDFKVLPVETPKIPQPVLQPMPRLPERTTLPPLEAPVIRIPTPAPKVPAPLLQPMPTIQERTTLPSIEMPVIRIPAETPSIPAPLLQPIAPLQERSALPPVERVPIDTSPRTPVPPVPDTSSRTPAPPATIRDPVTTPTVPDTSSRTPAPPATIRDPVSTPTETPSFKTPPAMRDSGSDYDPTKPSLDLDQMRKRAAEITRAGTGNRAAFPIPMPPVEKPKSKMEQAIENARKPDCNDAYKGLGLLAVVPLIANEFGEGTCRWR